MKLSIVIRDLQEVLKLAGDVEVVLATTDDSENFPVYDDVQAFVLNGPPGGAQQVFIMSPTHFELSFEDSLNKPRHIPETTE